MKKLLKYLGLGLGAIVILALVAGAYIQVKGIPSYPVEKVDFPVEVTPDKLARGEKLVATLCAGCHMDFETRKLTGRVMLDAPKEFGLAYAPNITQDKDFGIGDWSNGEIIYLLRTGIKRDGKYAPPWMAKLPLLSDNDAEAILAFLRSDHELVSPANVSDQPCEPSFLTKFLTHVAFTPFEYPSAPIPDPDTSDPVEWGKYLVFNFECYSCHSADFKTNNYLEPEKSEGYLGGGNKPLNLEGDVMLTQNLTPDMETGLGKMSEDAFVKLLKYGVKEGEHAMRYPMLPYSRLSDNEAKAIFAYLRTVPPINNDVPRSGL